MDVSDCPCVIKEQILWIVLPGGVCDPGRLRFSVFVSPRLHGPEGNGRCQIGSNSSFADWPTALRELARTFSLAIQGLERPFSVEPFGIQPASEVWKKLFSAQTMVEPFRPVKTPQEFDPPAVVSYDPTKLLNVLEERYGADVKRDLANGTGTGQPQSVATLEEEPRFEEPRPEQASPLEAILEFHRRPPTRVFPNLAAREEQGAFAERAPHLEAAANLAGDGQSDCESLPKIDPNFPTERSFGPSDGPFEIEACPGDSIGRGGTRATIPPYHRVVFRSTRRLSWFAREVTVQIRPEDQGQIFYADPEWDEEAGPQSLVFELPRTGRLVENGFHVTVKAVSRNDDNRDATPAIVRAAASETIEGEPARPVRQDDSRPVLRAGVGRWMTEEENIPDFHTGISALTSYPFLSRRLGLVLDFSLPVDLARLPAAGRIKIVPAPGTRETPCPDIEHCSPWTSYSLTTGRLRPVEASNGHRETATRHLFFAAPRLDPAGPRFRLDQGLLRNEGQPRHQLVQLDLDGTALKMNVRQNEERPPATDLAPPSERRPPALRQAGISLVDTGLPSQVQILLERCGNLEHCLDCNQEVTLYAQDVLQGYRIDVRRTNPQGEVLPWRSLCERRGEYWIGKASEGHEYFEHQDEGFVETVGDEQPGNEQLEKKKLRVAPTVFHWDGWSLCVERPGKGLNNNGTVETRRADSDGYCASIPPEATNPNIPLRVRFTPVPRRLERLRIHSSYSFRARTVDLAGNGLTVEQANELLDEPRPPEAVFHTKVPFCRFEPVEAPLLVPLQEVKEGGTDDRLVIRSYEDRPAEQAEWFVVPPKVSQAFAELHGVFDRFSEAKALYELLKARDGDLPEWDEEEPTAGEAGGQDRKPKKKGYDPAWLREHMDGSGHLTLPYLPDPLSRGAAFARLPGGDKDCVLSVPFVERGSSTSAYPYGVRPFRLRLSGGSPGYHTSDGRMAVQVPPGRTQAVKLSSCLHEEDRKCLALWNMAREHVAGEAGRCGPTYPLPADIDGDLCCVKKLCEGQLCLLTPEREITLVHAVPRPLLPPGAQDIEFRELLVERKPAQTTAPLGGYLHLDVPSTGKIDVEAEWTEQVDDPGLPSWFATDRRAQAFQLNLPPPVSDAKDEIESFSFCADHKFEDTRHRFVAYRAIATTRFIDYYPQPQDPADTEIVRKKHTRASTQIRIHIPSTARPKEPDVYYVVPTFVTHEERDTRKHRLERTRKGGGLRIYMRRGWFSSGDNEMLAVVLAPGHYADVPDFLRERITEWGADPIWKSETLPPRPILENFRSTAQRIPLIDLTVDVIKPPERPGENPILEQRAGKVAIAAYEVFLDEEKDLLYCDIDIEARYSYFPFVRLALARYQPYSIEKMHLSPVARADFIQITPDRTLTLKRESRDRYSVILTGISYVNDKDPSQRPTSEVEVSLEQRDQGLPESELSWTSVPGSTVRLEPRQIGEATWVWSGTITIRDDRRHRLTVVERELFSLDGSRGHARLSYSEVINLITPN